MNVGRSEIRDWNIYKIVSPSGKIYIGLTCNIKNRFYRYKKANDSSQTLLFNSLRKYGFDNHIVSIIDSFTSDISYAKGKEIFWIRTYMTNFSKWGLSHGLNLTDGGEGCFGLVHSEERKKKTSEFMKGKPSPFKGRKWTEEDKKRIGDSKRGNKNCVGLKRSDKQKEQISNRMKGNKLGGFIKGMPAWNKGLTGVQKSKYKGVPRTKEVKEKIRQKLLGKPSSTKGRKCTDAQKEKFRQIALNRPRPHRQFPIIYLGTVDNPCYKEYDSLKLASDDTGINRSMISYYAKGKCKKPNHIFKYKKMLEFKKVSLQRRIFKQQEIKVA